MKSLVPSADERYRLHRELYLERLKRRRRKGEQASLARYIRRVWGDTFIIEEAHLLLCGYLEALYDGVIDRLMTFMSPRAGKSRVASIAGPSWYLGRRPGDLVMQIGHSQPLSTDFGRETKDLILTEDYQDLFPGVLLRADVKAAGRWHTNQRGGYLAAGVGTNIAGKGFNWGSADDLLSEQTYRSDAMNKRVIDWWGPGFYTRRQMDRSAISLTMCMTGCTPVLMADGREKCLRDVRPMDEVATYDDGCLATSRVSNWRSNGVDSIYKVTTQSGRIFRANERHPFLVENNGEREWVRVRELTLGMALVSLSGALDPHGQKISRGYAAPARRTRHTTRSTLMHRIVRGITVSGKVRPVFTMGAWSLSVVLAIVRPTMGKSFGRQGIATLQTPQRSDVTGDLNSVTGSPKKGSTAFSRARAAFARCASNLLQNTTPALIGTISCALTTITQRRMSGGCSVTTAISRLDMQKPQQQRMQSPHTSDFTTDRITEIVPDGAEEVFDVEIERTENFIANGFVSHNTRWRKDDIAGHLLQLARDNKEADQYSVVRIPALIDDLTAEMLNELAGEPILREGPRKERYKFKAGDSFMPRRFPMRELKRIKANQPTRDWEALYQQNPTQDEGAILKRKWWRKWPGGPNAKTPECMYLIQMYDTAFEEKEVNDFSARTTWGVFEHTDNNGIVRPCVILLETWKDRVSFPDLRQLAYQSYKLYKPDRVLIEKKASGHSLVQELKKKKVPVEAVEIAKGASKTARAHAASVVLEQGCVFYMDRQWAQDVITECAEFPFGDFNDIADTCVHAWIWLRKRWWVQLGDEEDEDEERPEEVRPFG